MKRKEIKELHQKTKDELVVLLNKANIELGKLLAEKQAGEVKNPHQIGSKRQDLARIKSIMKEKSL